MKRPESMIVGILGVSLSLCVTVAEAQHARAEHRDGTSISRGAKGGGGDKQAGGAKGGGAKGNGAKGNGAKSAKNGNAKNAGAKNGGAKNSGGRNDNGRSERRARSDRKKRGNGHGYNLPGYCSYPPQRKPEVHRHASRSRVHDNEKFTVSGQVKINSCGVKHTSVGVFTSTSPAGPFTYWGATSTTADGDFKFILSQAGTTHYKLASAPTSSYGAGTSDVFTVEQVR